jgi:ATP-dependent 26S proteasome regulatory subunit
LDEAFLRRFQINVQFAMPDEGDRQRIWRGMFPREASVAADVDFADIARSFDLSGGEIKNAALAAAFMAASQGSDITHAIVQRAAVREMMKAGRVVPDEILRRVS